MNIALLREIATGRHFNIQQYSFYPSQWEIKDKDRTEREGDYSWSNSRSSINPSLIILYSPIDGGTYS